MFQTSCWETLKSLGYQNMFEVTKEPVIEAARIWGTRISERRKLTEVGSTLPFSPKGFPICNHCRAEAKELSRKQLLSKACGSLKGLRKQKLELGVERKAETWGFKILWLRKVQRSEASTMWHFFSQGNSKFISRAGKETKKLRGVKPMRSKSELLTITHFWKEWKLDFKARWWGNAHLRVKARVWLRLIIGVYWK